MSLNSVNTNISAAIALAVRVPERDQLGASRPTQKQVSTGYRVADATDDGAAFAVAQTRALGRERTRHRQPAARQCVKGLADDRR